jgi:hypothetical protein
MSDARTLNDSTPRRESRRILRTSQTSATSVAAFALVVLSLALSGCTSPSAANIALRKQVQTQQEEIERLKRQYDAVLADYHVQPGRPPTSQPISADQAQLLFTMHGVRLGKLSRADEKGLTLHVIPTDDDGQDLKVAGSIVVDAYDLSDAGQRVGRWEFDAAKARSLWNGNLLRYEYVVPCPWTQPPTANELTVKVTFVDALTGRTFTTQKAIKKSS